MINHERLSEVIINYEEFYNNGLKQLVNYFGNIDRLEFISFLSFVNRVSSYEGKYGISPTTIEFLIGVALSQKGNDSALGKGTVEEALQAWKLGDELLEKWAGYTYFDNLSVADSSEEIKRKIFASSMKVNYGLTRGYSWYRVIEQRHISQIFDSLNKEMEDLIGFYPSEVWKIVDAYEKHIGGVLNSFREYKLDFEDNDLTDPIKVYGKLFVYDFKRLMQFKAEDIASECDISLEHIKAFLEFFSFDIDSMPDNKYRYITDDSQYKEKPIIRNGNLYNLPLSQEIFWKLRKSIENRIKQNEKLWNRYDKNHKAKFLEDESIRLFRKLLPQCLIFNTLYYYPEGIPSGCELDGIALYDNIIILIEAKSGIYSKAAQRGGLLKLETVVEKNIEYAYTQGNRTKDFILGSKEAVFYSDKKKTKEALRINSENYRHIFIINTTLDYFAELGVDLYKLRNLGIYKEKEFPWTVCISDLEVISDFMDFPNQFVYYLMMRSYINNTLSENNHVKSLYELDLLAMYKLENTEEFYQYNHDAVNEQVLIDLLEEKENDKPYEVQMCICNDFTLYFYNYYAEYLYTGKKPKVIEKKYNERFLAMSRQLEEYEEFGYSSFVLRFLDLDLDNQNWLMEKIDQLCEMSKKDKKMHEMTIKAMPTQFIDERYGTVVYVGYLKDKSKITNLSYSAGIKQQGLTGIKEWITLCIFLDDDRHFINQFFYHFGNEESARIAESIVHHIPFRKNREIGRNDPCPCGSGLKYKKCCGNSSKIKK